MAVAGAVLGAIGRPLAGVWPGSEVGCMAVQSGLSSTLQGAICRVYAVAGAGPRGLRCGVQGVRGGCSRGAVTGSRASISGL